MASFNSCTFSGRSGNDAEAKTFASGNSVAKFRLAVDRYGKKGEPKPAPLWIAVEVWGRQAQTVGDYVKKGTQIIVSGELSMDEWQKKDGEKQTTPTLRCMSFVLLGGERPGGSPMAAKQSQPDPEEDDIPF